MQPAPYRTCPVLDFPHLSIAVGYDALAEEIGGCIHDGTDLVLIDGFVGIPWDSFVGRLRSVFCQRGSHMTWLSTEQCFRSPCEIECLLAPWLTDDPVFGRIFRGHLEELWDAKQAHRLRGEVAARAGPVIIYGFGASLIAPGGLRIYVDVPKDRGQERAAAGTITNVGAPEPSSFGAMYKRMYFADWPMLNRIKRAMLPQIDLLVDAADEDMPKLVHGEAFRCALRELAHRPFRVKPWFAPGPWGGQWMKDRFGLPREEPNYAWSFELIAPENGVLLGDGGETFECSFDHPLWQETDAVLGPSVAARYGSYFPIRFDYLDTMGGTNLSCQVHPRLDYIRDEFGEPFTQDETYYIVTCKPGARVFLGLRDDADLERFKAAATSARDQGIPFDIASHVNSVPSAAHDLFLIPSGTVHCSGADNLVLEISATPYIYTFKIYDYLRRDLRGELRHVHIDHAFANLDGDRRSSWVRSNLCPGPVALRQGSTWAEYRLGDIDRLFFAIHRLEFEQSVEDATNGRFLVLNLVEGERCEIVTDSHAVATLRFAETIVIPASIGPYTLRNTGDSRCRVVKAFVKG
jgi:mannose-6-phosphate isomerase class I